MSTIFRLSLLALALAVLSARGGAGQPGHSPQPAPADRFAVVELFTSQGCSSCPPADRLLSKLAQDARYQGKVIPLSFHVDYWNYIGWTDPYGNEHGAVLNAGSYYVFDVPASLGASTRADGINDMGTIVGRYIPTGGGSNFSGFQGKL